MMPFYLITDCKTKRPVLDVNYIKRTVKVEVAGKVTALFKQTFTPRATAESDTRCYRWELHSPKLKPPMQPTGTLMCLAGPLSFPCQLPMECTPVILATSIHHSIWLLSRTSCDEHGIVATMATTLSLLEPPASSPDVPSTPAAKAKVAEAASGGDYKPGQQTYRPTCPQTCFCHPPTTPWKRRPKRPPHTSAFHHSLFFPIHRLGFSLGLEAAMGRSHSPSFLP